ncbi:MAG: methyltransferase domain-containing protein [Saprospiraceae bacterium]|nr:methyltransferase domain-containing protein [Saprospiraceae bacterium]
MDLSEVVLFDNAARHPWELARLQVVKETLASILDNANPKAEPFQILDIGCGDTFVIAKLAEYFPQARFIGLDINFTAEQLSTFQEKYTGTNVTIHKSWDAIELEPSAIDVVLLLDVIEHIEDEISFMSSVADNALIRDDTHFFITVPAYQSLFAAHDVILGHFRRYTSTSLKKRLAQAGLQTEMTRYFFSTLLFPRLAQKLIEKIKPRDVQAGSDVANWKGGEGTSKLIKNILILDYRVGSFFKAIGINIPGLSNLALCKRSV